MGYVLSFVSVIFYSYLFRGVVLLEANFEAIQINQCAEDGSLFSGTHRCLRASTTVSEGTASTEKNLSTILAVFLLPLLLLLLLLFLAPLLEPVLACKVTISSSTS